MKISKLLIVGVVLIVFTLCSCENEEVTYPDFEYQTVYFANQYPVRTIELGKDLFVDNSLDNEHRFMIKATTGGAYTNNNDIVIDFRVEESLCDSLYFDNGVKVTPMPSNYYQLADDQINIAAGSIMGGVEVQLTDAFFEDTNSLGRFYVIPLLLTDVQGADSILQGIPLNSDPNRCINGDWSITPQDFVLYAVKYVNPWHGNYLRRGTDYITRLDGTDTVSHRHAEFIEDNEVVKVTTFSFTEATLPLTLYGTDGSKVVDTNIKLEFTDDENCMITGGEGVFTISGNGTFVPNGDKNSIGGIDRDVLYLDYHVKFSFLSLAYDTKDTLVVRDRAVAPQYFSVVLQ